MDRFNDVTKTKGLSELSRDKKDNNFKLVPYVNRADQEFTGLKPYMWENWDNEKPWANDIAWDNVPWQKTASNLPDLVILYK